MVNAINRGLLDQPLFTVYLHRTAEENTPGGLITIGGIDTVNCDSSIIYQPLSSATYFQFRMDSITLGSFTSSAGWEVISDTGTSWIGGPQNIIDRLASVAGATCDDQNNVFRINCNTNPGDFIFRIGANQFNIQPTNYIDNGGGDNNCYFTFFGFDSGGFGPSWILGDTFIRQYCNVYDIGQQRMGFAASKQQ